MFRNYLKTALRNLWRYKGFAAVNILGLTIGIAGCLVIALFVRDENQYDNFIPDGETIHRVYEQRNDNGVISNVACVPPAFASFLKQQYPEVVSSARIMMSGNKFLVENGDKKAYEDKGILVDSTFFEVFPLKLVAGSIQTALKSPESLVISENMARRYFGNEDPIGKTLLIDKSSMTVKAVMATLPSRFHLNFEYLMALSSAGIPAERMENWTWHQFYTYVKLKPGTNAMQLQDKFQSYVKKEIFPTLKQSGSTFLPVFQPLRDIHLGSSDFVYDNAVRGNKTYVRALSIIALFVLVIACFNFINLATARSFRRAKEIGVRKVAGAGRRQLIFQFLNETILLSLFSTLFATALCFFLVPMLNDFTGKTISFRPFTNAVLGLTLVFGGIMIGILAGLYPALILSGFKPIKVLKNMKHTEGNRIPWLRQGLVVIQFSLSVLLIVSSIIVFRQTKFLNTADLGFNKDQVVYFQLRDSLASNSNTLETFKSELRRLPGITSVTSGYGLPGDQFAGEGVNIPSRENQEFISNVFIGDHDYVKTLGLRIITGRDFSRDLPTDVTEGFLINETAVKEWGFGSPDKAIGQAIHWDEWAPADTTQPVKKGKVIGVVQDFHYKSLREKLIPSVIQLYPQVSFTVALKINTADMKTALDKIAGKWNSFVQGYPIEFKFMDDSYGAMYSGEEKLSELLWIFTLMAIFIGCMGLFGLAAFSAEQKTKEIGIRKILGANVFNIVGLLSKNFLLLVIVSALIAIPVAWWAMNDWLNEFPYRVAISWWIFGIAVLAALGVAFITVSFQSVKAALSNPVKSLRTE